jgi:hypothetical protein
MKPRTPVEIAPRSERPKRCIVGVAVGFRSPQIGRLGGVFQTIAVFVEERVISKGIVTLHAAGLPVGLRDQHGAGNALSGRHGLKPYVFRLAHFFVASREPTPCSLIYLPAGPAICHSFPSGKG